METWESMSPSQCAERAASKACDVIHAYHIGTHRPPHHSLLPITLTSSPVIQEPPRWQSLSSLPQTSYHYTSDMCRPLVIWSRETKQKMNRTCFKVCGVVARAEGSAMETHHLKWLIMKCGTYELLATSLTGGDDHM